MQWYELHRELHQRKITKISSAGGITVWVPIARQIATEILSLDMISVASSPASSDPTAQVVSLPNPDDVLFLMRTVLSAPSVIFTEDFFTRPLCGLTTPMKLQSCLVHPSCRNASLVLYIFLSRSKEIAVLSFMSGYPMPYKLMPTTTLP